MAFKSNINSQIRGAYFSPSGASDNVGTSIEKPLATMQQPIDLMAALIPPPGFTEIAVVSAAQGGSFSTGFVLEDFIQFNGEDVSITTSAPIAVDTASFLSCRLTTLINTQTNGVCFNVNGEQSLGINCSFIGVPENGIGVKVAGVVDDLFFNLSQIVLDNDGGIGIDITASMTTPIDMNLNAISLNANNVTFCRCNPVNPIDTCTINVSSIKKSSSGTNTKGFDAQSGTLVIESGNIEADDVINVESGAIGDILCSRADGDISVALGATFNGIIVEYAGGTILENGTINGLIGGKPFGKYRQKPKQESVLTGSSFVTQSPVGQDNPLQVKFGTAQFGPSDPVQIDALGNVTINQTDQYIPKVLFHAGRTGAGSFAVLLFRFLLNGSQIGDSTAIRLDNANTHFPVEISLPPGLTNFTATDVLTVEIWRDSTGFDAGSLFPETPTLVGSNPVSSASISMTRARLTQPV